MPQTGRCHPRHARQADAAINEVAFKGYFHYWNTSSNTNTQIHKYKYFTVTSSSHFRNAECQFTNPATIVGALRVQHPFFTCFRVCAYSIL